MLKLGGQFNSSAGKLSDKNAVKEKIADLVGKYRQIKNMGMLRRYSEEETKKDFILPLFETLGWRVFDKREVSAEESIISSGRVDYGFYLNGRSKFYLEAKPLKADLHRVEYANQAVRYSWNKGVTWAVLTDFESIKVFNAQDIERSLADKLYFEISCSEYIERFDQLWLLSKEAFAVDLIDKEAEKIGKKFQKVPISSLLCKDLNKCRDILTNALSQWNEKVNKDLLDEGAQKLLDRLIFLRVAEDRGIEQSTLIPLIRAWEAGEKKEHLYQSMIRKFRELDEIYNSNLFSEHPFEHWEEYSNATEKVIEILYGKKGYYEYDFKVMPADVLGSVYENYLGYRLAQSQKGISVSKDAKKRKEQGIYYTPAYIVDYITRSALKPVLDKCSSIADLKKIKVLDPACGSGSFLVKALEVINEKYKEFGNPGNVWTKLNILIENIYGVDLDEQAVEIARLNLLINALDERMKLPFLDRNIKNGNSLISGTDEELQKHFGKNFMDKKPFNWQEEFPEVFKQGGFDVVIGNPPYLKELDNKELFQEIRKSNLGKYYQGKMDFWYFFLHRAIDLVKDGGIVAFITNSYFLKSAGATRLIDHLKNDTVLVLAVDFQNIPIFEDVSGRHLIHIWKKAKDKNGAITKYIQLDKESFRGIIDEGNVMELPYKDITKDSSISFSKNVNINSNDDIILLGSTYDVSQGVVEATDKISKKTVISNTDLIFKAGDGIFVLSEKELKNINIDKQEKLVIKKYLNTNDVKKYYIDFKGEYLIYSNKETKEKIAKGDYPHLKDHLDKVKQFITSSNAPYGLHRPRENKYFENPKLVCKGMFLTPEFCFDDEKYYVGFSFSVIIEKDKNYDLKYLLGLLNSSFARRWFNLNGKKRGIGVDIGVAVFRKFPVYKANKEQQKQIIVLVDKILNLNGKLHNAEENSNEWHSIKSDIEKTDKKIDDEVYKLYGLKREEIKIIESAF